MLGLLYAHKLVEAKDGADDGHGQKELTQVRSGFSLRGQPEGDGRCLADSEAEEGPSITSQRM